MFDSQKEKFACLLFYCHLQKWTFHVLACFHISRIAELLCAPEPFWKTDSYALTLHICTTVLFHNPLLLSELFVRVLCSTVFLSPLHWCIINHRSSVYQPQSHDTFSPSLLQVVPLSSRMSRTCLATLHCVKPCNLTPSLASTTSSCTPVPWVTMLVHALNSL